MEALSIADSISEFDIKLIKKSLINKLSNIRLGQ